MSCKAVPYGVPARHNPGKRLMFNPFKKLFTGKEEKRTDEPDTRVLAQWAHAKGLTCTMSEPGADVICVMQGRSSGRPWRMEMGKRLRDFVRGDELRVRVDLKADPEVAVIVMNRPLKSLLERRAYQLYTDSVQTTADPQLPEEMRWLAVYQEFGWDQLPRPFWDSFSVMADERAHAISLIDASVCKALMGGLEAGIDAQVPLVISLQRGRLYLRMQHRSGNAAELNHVLDLLDVFCASGAALKAS